MEEICSTTPEKMDTYVVLEGESLQGVALKTGVRASQLKAMNKLYSDSLYPGQRLSLRNPHYIPPPPLPSTPMTPIPSSSSSSPLQAVSPAVPAPSREAFDFQADFSNANSSPPPFVPSSPPQPPQQPAYSFFDFDPFGNSQSQQPEPSHDEPDFLSESTPSKRSHRSPSFQDTFFSLLSTVIGSHPSHDDRNNNNINSGGSPPSKRNSSEEDLTTPSWHEVLSFPNLLNLSRDKEEEEKGDEDIRRAALERDRINSTNLNHPSIAPSTMGPDSWAPSPSLIGGPSSILSSAQIDLLHRQLPIILQFDAWHLLYSVLENGADITSFYRLAGTTRYSLIIIETALGDVFGGFASSSWQTNKEFYGTGESFVFLFVDEALQKFKWTQENELIMFSNHEKVGMGAGADGFAFLLDADFYTGGSYRSSTFGNPPLASKENFRVKNVEVWGFESALQVPPKRKIRNK